MQDQALPVGAATAVDRHTAAARQRTAYLLLGTAAIALGGTWVAGKVAVAELGPLALSTVRFGLASVVLGAWIVARSGPFVRPTRRDLPLILAMALTGVAGFSPMFFLGLERAPASDGAVLTPGLAPIVAAAVASVAFSEPLTRRMVLGLATAIVGLVLVVGPSTEGSDTRLVGDLLYVVAAVAWGLYTVIGRAATARFGPMNATFYATIAGTLVLVPFGLLEGGWAGLATASPEALASMVYLGVVATVVAFVFWYEGVSRIGPSRASAFTFLVPIVGVSSSVLVLGERPGPTTLLGGAIVLLALWIIQRAPR